MTDVAVVGAGIVGLATAYRLLEARPALRVAVVEAEHRVGAHQSSHNSGVLHAGVYYPPGSLKATLSRQGKAALERFAADHGIPVMTNGKVIVATDPSELPRLDEIERRARANGVPGLARLDPGGLAAIEPHVAGIAALHSPTTGVTDFGAVTRALAAEVIDRGGAVHLGSPVVAITERRGGVTVTTTRQEVSARAVITCGGLQSDRLATLTGDDDGSRIVPFRGSWSLLGPNAADAIRGNVYPVPDPAQPFLGVHFTRHPDGTVWVGPNAVLAGSRHGYHRGDWDRRDLRDLVTHRGFWRLAGRHVRTGAREFVHDRIRTRYLREVQRYLPELEAADLLPGPSGVRAQLVAPDGTLVDDFVLAGRGRVVHVRNAPSPAATAALAIGERLRDVVLARL